MTKLESFIERLRALPEDKQEALMEEIEFFLGGGGQSVLTDEQWAEVERELAEDDGTGIPHEQVKAELQARFGK